MAVRTVEAQLVVSGQDKGASKVINDIAKAMKVVDDQAKVTKPMQDLAKVYDGITQRQKLVDQALASRKGAEAAAASLAQVRDRAAQVGAQVDAARAALKAFENQKVSKGTEMARQASEATKTYRDLTKAQRDVERQVGAATRVVEQQSTALRQSERALRAAGAPLHALERHQRELRVAYDTTTGAIQRQIRVEQNAATAARRHASERVEAAHHVRQHGVIGYAASAAAGAVAAHSVGHAVGHTVRAGARYQHEVVSLRNAGRTPEEMREIEHASHETIKAVPTATFEENLKVVNETTGAFGSLHHAIENLTFMQKSASVLHAAAGDKIKGGAGELGNKLARFFEERQVAGNTPVFQREAEGLVRAMAFTRGNFNPHEALNFAQQAKSALPNYSERFLTRIAPSLVTMLGGDRAGTAANAFNSVITGKVNDKKQAEEWMRYGLLDPKQAIMKAGHAVGWRAGAVKNTNLALSDPLKWVEDVMLPAMRAKGVKVDDRLELTKALATMFRNSNSNVFANDLAQPASRTRLHKDEEMIGKAGTLDEIYKRNLTEDPTVGLKAVTSALDNLMTTASSPLMETAGGAIKVIAGSLNEVALAAKDHPNFALAGGVGIATAGFGASGALAYKLSTGFGLKGSAVALDASAVHLSEAAVALGGKGGLPGAAKRAGAVGAGAITAAPLAVGAAVIGGAVLAGGRQQPEEMVRLRSELGDLNKTLDRRGEAVSRAETQGGDVQAAKARVDETRQRMDAIQKRLKALDAGAALIDQGGPILGDRESKIGRERNRLPAPSVEPVQVRAAHRVPPLPPPAPDREVPVRSGSSAARTDIEKLRADLAGINAEIARAVPDFAGSVAAPLSARKAEIERLLAEAEDRLKRFGEAGRPVGERVGQGIADGVAAKAPEVEQQGQGLFDRLKSLFSEGIKIPISLDTGNVPAADGAAAVQRASHRGAGGGLIHKASLAGTERAVLNRPSFGAERARAHRSSLGGKSGADVPVGPTGSFPGVATARLPAGMRNNNPGNIKYTGKGAFAGVVGPSRNTDQGDAQAVFDSPESGMRAATNLALRKYERGRHTVDALVAARGGWTPGNREAAANIARSMGVRPNQEINLREPGQMGRFMRGLLKQEHGPASRLYSDEMIQRSIRGRPDREVAPKMMPERELPVDYQGGRGSGVDRETAEMFRASVEDLKAMNLRTHHTVEVQAAPGLSARTKSMRAHGEGPLKPNVGVTMPDAEGGRWI